MYTDKLSVFMYTGAGGKFSGEIEFLMQLIAGGIPLCHTFLDVGPAKIIIV